MKPCCVFAAGESSRGPATKDSSPGEVALSDAWPSRVLVAIRKPEPFGSEKVAFAFREPSGA
jgi:hypothetical protein